MFDKLKKLMGSSSAHDKTKNAEARLAAMQAQFGEPEHIDHDSAQAHRVDIYAYGRNFVEACDTDAADDEGYVLMTSGMSDRLMHAPKQYGGEEPLAIELIWYVRDLNPEYFANLRWLAEFPFIDNTWLGHGHTIPMPEPPLSFCRFKHFLILPPIIRSDRDLLDGVAQEVPAVGTLCVHLVSDAEYRLIKTDDGLDEFLDLLDAKGYPAIFDPARVSYVDA